MIKRAENDLTIEGLPHNRVQVFFDCIKERLLLLLLIGVIVAAGAVPLIVTGFLFDNAAMNAATAFNNGLYDEAQIVSLLYYYKIIFGVAAIVGLIIFAVVCSGVMRVIRQLVWGEGVFAVNDFLDGVKTNGALYAVIGLIGGLIAFFYSLAEVYADPSGILFVFVKCLTLAILCPIGLLMLSEIVIYKLGLFGHFKNAVIIFIKTVPTTLLGAALFVAPYFLVYIDNFVIKYALFLLVALIYAPLVMMGWFLYCCYVFDKYVNAENYPELYDKGVYRMEKEDTNIIENGSENVEKNTEKHNNRG